MRKLIGSAVLAAVLVGLYTFTFGKVKGARTTANYERSLNKQVAKSQTVAFRLEPARKHREVPPDFNTTRRPVTWWKYGEFINRKIDTKRFQEKDLKTEMMKTTETYRMKRGPLDALRLDRNSLKQTETKENELDEEMSPKTPLYNWVDQTEDEFSNRESDSLWMEVESKIESDEKSLKETERNPFDEVTSTKTTPYPWWDDVKSAFFYRKNIWIFYTDDQSGKFERIKGDPIYSVRLDEVAETENPAYQN